MGGDELPKEIQVIRWRWETGSGAVRSCSDAHSRGWDLRGRAAGAEETKLSGLQGKQGL